MKLEIIICKRRININNSEIITNLRTLGLEAGANFDDIHSAFRKLARELHPDVTGQKSNFRFQQVTGAYSLLKTLTPEELEAAAQSRPIQKTAAVNNPVENIAGKIDAILDKYESEIKDYNLTHQTIDEAEIKAIIFRLKSRNPKVINSALKHSGHIVNRVEFRKAFTEILKRPELDESTGIIASSLQFDDMTRKLIAFDAADNAANIPTGLIISLAGSDSDIMESFLLHVKPDDVAVILRRWPTGKIMSAKVIKYLLASDDAKILVPILGAINTHFPKSALQHKKRLEELASHSAAAVRAWSRKLL